MKEAAREGTRVRRTNYARCCIDSRGVPHPFKQIQTLLLDCNDSRELHLYYSAGNSLLPRTMEGTIFRLSIPFHSIAFSSINIYAANRPISIHKESSNRIISSILSNFRIVFFILIFFVLFTGGRHSIRYSIYSGDPDGFFRIDPVTGSIRTARSLDHETRANVLLNVQATCGDPPIYGHTQVSKKK